MTSGQWKKYSCMSYLIISPARLISPDKSCLSFFTNFNVLPDWVLYERSECAMPTSSYDWRKQFMSCDAEEIWCFRKTNQNADLLRLDWASVSLLEPKCKCRVWSACKWCDASWRPLWKTNGVYQPVSAVWPGCHLISFFLKVVFISIHHCCCYIN